MNLVFFGSSAHSVIGAKIIHQTHPLSLVVTIPDKPIGRDATLTPSPVKVYANDENIPFIEADKLTDEVIDKIAEVNPDFLIVEDYGLILPTKLLNLSKKAPLNIHPSLLPKYRGPSPATAPILNGDKETGVTIIKLVDELDAGDILVQKEIPLKGNETTTSLLDELNTLGGKLILDVINNFDSLKATPQNNARVSFTKKIKKEDGYFDINQPPSIEILDRMIRAYYPWPNVWTRWNNKIVKFYPGGLVQMEGKNKIPMKEFTNGHRGFPIKNLISNL